MNPRLLTQWTHWEWTRRDWLASHAATALLVATRSVPSLHPRAGRVAARLARLTRQAERWDPGPWQALALRAVDAARSAGAQYADVRLSRLVVHTYGFGDEGRNIGSDLERVGVGIRALVQGYWGFAACPSGDAEAVVRLAQDAVAQARTNAQGPPRTVELGAYPPAVGSWATPVKIDPFIVPIEEKGDYIGYWLEYARRIGLWIDTLRSHLAFTRQERVVATSEGACFTQTCYESGGKIVCNAPADLSKGFGSDVSLELEGLDATGRGWELFTDEAKIPEQLDSMPERLHAEAALLATARPSTVGRYTLVMDGRTMASVLDRTLGVATQLDRALGYEANAGGTSYLDDPLGMVGHFQVASPRVTVTANRSAPTQLATVKWDDEGVLPQPFTVVKEGIVTDFQTTREQAEWLAPYYHRQGQPIRSHGCAAAPEALAITMQHPPNLALTPGAAAVRLEELVADVTDGMLVTAGEVYQVDFQARTGMLMGRMRQIKNGQLGHLLTAGAVLFETLDLWKRIEAVGGPSTQAVKAFPQAWRAFDAQQRPAVKGQPPQWTSHSVSGVAATVPNQALIDPRRKA